MQISKLKKVLLSLVLGMCGVLTLGLVICSFPAGQMALTNVCESLAEEDELPELPPIQDGERALVAPVASITPALRDIAFDLLAATVRVRVDQGSGTGVILWSELSQVTQKYHTFIITNSHAVKNSKTVEIDSFSYMDRKTIACISTYTAAIVRNSSDLDLALLEVRSDAKIGRAAHFVTAVDLDRISLYDQILVCGSGLGEPPYITRGNLAIFQEDHHLITAFSIFGNSGGGAFTEHGKLFGVVSGIRAVEMPGLTLPEPNLTNCIPSFVVTTWLEASQFFFILDENPDLADAYFRQTARRGRFY